MVCEACVLLTSKLRSLRAHLLMGSDSEPLEALDEVCQLLNLSLYKDERDACQCVGTEGPIDRHTCGRLGPEDRRSVAVQVDGLAVEGAQQLVMLEEGDEDMVAIDLDTARSVTFQGWLQLSPGDAGDSGGTAGLMEGGLAGMLVPLRLFQQYIRQSAQGEATSLEGGGGPAEHGARQGEAEQQSQRKIDLRGEPEEPGRHDCGAHARGESALQESGWQEPGRATAREAEEASFWFEINHIVRQMMAKGAGDAEILARLKGVPGGDRIRASLLFKIRGMFPPPRAPTVQGAGGWSVQEHRPRRAPAPLEQDVVMASLRYETPTYSIDATGGNTDTSACTDTDTATASPCSDHSRSPLLDAASPPHAPTMRMPSIESDSDVRSQFDTERAQFQGSHGSPSDRGSHSPGSPWGCYVKGPVEIAHIVL